MKKIDPTVIRETRYIFAVTLILSVFMEAVFLVIGKWELSVLLGNILGAAAAVGNFLLLGITVQSAVLKEEKEARNLIKLSQTLRFFMLIAIAIVGYLVPIFNPIAVIIPLLFPRVAIALRPFVIKDKD